MSFSFPSPLYPIVDPAEAPGRTHRELAAAMLAAGVRFLQLRCKEEPSGRFVELARELKGLADRHGARLIINDRTDIARLVDAAGVHLGQEDLPPVEARRILGPGKIVGFSTHNDEQIRAALKLGAVDYLAFGPVFRTGSKARPDPTQGLAGLRRARALCPLPLVAIGGITAATIQETLATGADAVAVIAAISHAADPGQATAALLRQVATTPPNPPRS